VVLSDQLMVYVNFVALCYVAETMVIFEDGHIKILSKQFVSIKPHFTTELHKSIILILLAVFLLPV